MIPALSGLDDTLLDEFLFDEEEERRLTTYEKWAIVRHAAEQVGVGRGVCV